jgi:hypothetical protein
VLVGESDKDGDGSRLRDRVGIRVQDVLPGGRRDPEVDVRGERERPRILEHANSLGHRARRPRDVRDDDHLVDLKCESRERALELACVAVRDDDRRDRHAPSISL